MSRLFEKREIIRHKCDICGSNNKLFTEFKYGGIHYGYHLTCCNCGHMYTFIDSLNGPSGMHDSLFHKGDEFCIRRTTCHNKGCKYYGSKLWDAADNLDRIKLGIPADGEGDECNCDTCTKCAAQNGKSNAIELELNAGCNCNPRFH